MLRLRSVWSIGRGQYPSGNNQSDTSLQVSFETMLQSTEESILIEILMIGIEYKPSLQCG